MVFLFWNNAPIWSKIDDLAVYALESGYRVIDRSLPHSVIWSLGVIFLNFNPFSVIPVHES